jgi:hypothetical protein
MAKSLAVTGATFRAAQAVVAVFLAPGELWRASRNPLTSSGRRHIFEGKIDMDVEIEAD